MQHLCEVFVGVYACTHVCVVLLELAERNDSVLFLCVPKIQELLLSLLWTLLSLEDIWVRRDVEDLSDIFESDLPVLLQLIIGSSDPLEAILVQGTLKQLVRNLP